MARLPLPILLLMLVLVQTGESVWLNLPKSGNKCVFEEIQNDVVVVAEYVVMSEGSDLTISIKVTSPHGNLIHLKENATHGEFAFTSTESGAYLICFFPDHTDQGTQLSVNFDWKTGIAAKNWDLVAKREKIVGVVLELRKLQLNVEAIQDYLVYRKSREALLTGVSETTNSRVAWYSISSLGICILASSTQLWYLTRFFQKKKLI